MVRWIGLVLITPKTCDNHRERDKPIEIEHVSLRKKMVKSFKWGKINAIALE